MHVVFVMANNSSVPYFNWFAEVASQQHEVKFSFICMYPTQPKMLEDMAHYGCDCYWVKYNAATRKNSMLKSILPLFRLFKKLKPDVVHTHLFDDSLPALFAAKLAGVKTRAITKGDAGYHYYHTPQWVKFDKFNNFNATDIVAISSENQQFILEKEKPKKEKVSLIHHGIPIPFFTGQSENDKKMLIKRYQLEGKTVIGTVARLIEWKGYRYIIEAAEKLVPTHPHLAFLFVGTGEQEEELKTLVAEKGLGEYITFTGWVDRKLIPSLYGILDLYIHAASYEPFGFVIAEALVNGVPMISTPTGAALDALEHKKNGYLVPYKDPDAIAEGVSYLLNQDLSSMSAEAERIGKMKYDFNLMWENHILLYQN